MVKLFRPAGPEHTATGIVADSHCIPFSSPFAAPAMRSAAGEPLRCKYTKKSGRGTAAAKIKCPSAPNGPTARQSEKEAARRPPFGVRRREMRREILRIPDASQPAAMVRRRTADTAPPVHKERPPAGGQPRRERHPGPALHAAIRSPGRTLRRFVSHTPRPPNPTGRRRPCKFGAYPCDGPKSSAAAMRSPSRDRRGTEPAHCRSEDA